MPDGAAEAQDFEALYRDQAVREEARGAPFVAIRLEEQAHASASGRASIGTKSKKRSRKARRTALPTQFYLTRRSELRRAAS